MKEPRRDAFAHSEIRRHIALSGLVRSPAPNSAIGSERDGVKVSPSYADARAQILRHIALSVLVVTPSTDVAIPADCDRVIPTRSYG